jgi:hypothetical protein
MRIGVILMPDGVNLMFEEHSEFFVLFCSIEIDQIDEKGFVVLVDGMDFAFLFKFYLQLVAH